MAKKVKKTTKKAVAKKTVAKKKTVKKAVKKKTVAKKATKKKAASSKKALSKKTAKKKAVVKKKATAKKAVKKTVKKATKKKIAVRKKTTAAKSAPKRRKRRKTNLSKTELAHYRELLITKLKEIMGDVNHIELESLKKSRMDASGDLSSMPIHMADVGSDNYEQEFALGLMDSERKIVKEIHSALKRIDSGTYGICEGTQEPIPKPRLEGIPWTRYCVQYAEMLEKGLVVVEQNWYDDDAEDDEDDSYDQDDALGDDEDDYNDGAEDDIDEMYFGFDKEE